MKGKKGGESPAHGVRIDEPAPPHTGGARIMAAAKKRKRGGAVMAMKVEGEKPKMRMDKPGRARGGSVDTEKEIGAKDAMSKDIKADTKALHKVEDKIPGRMRGGKVGADTKPFSHARKETPMKGHTATGDL